MTNVFSSTKSLTAIAMASLVDKVECLRRDADEEKLIVNGRDS